MNKHKKEDAMTRIINKLVSKGGSKEITLNWEPTINSESGEFRLLCNGSALFLVRTDGRVYIYPNSLKECGLKLAESSE